MKAHQIPGLRRLLCVGVALCLPGGLPATEATITPKSPIILFNGTDTTGWTAYPKTPEGEPATWSVAEGLIRCTGRPNGYLYTDLSYKNYRFTVEWRWVPAEMPADNQGRPLKRNSGILVHMQGADAIWPICLECQLMEGNAGDFFVAGGVETIEWRALRNQALSAPGADAAALKKAQNNRRTPKQQPSSERPLGEWNTYEIVCRSDTVTVTVNGIAQNRATGVSVSEGRIGLQSEGAPIEFRNVRLDPL